MYAVIADSGRQYKVEEGQILDVDYRDVAKGDAVQFDQVLAVSADDGIKVGQPVVDGATVSGEVVGVRMGPKLIVQKLRRRKNSRRKTGHRQMYTRVLINKISV